MSWTPTRSPDDEEDAPESPDRTLEDLIEELTGEPAPPGDAAEELAAALTEAEREGVSGFESPPDRIA